MEDVSESLSSQEDRQGQGSCNSSPVFWLHAGIPETARHGAHLLPDTPSLSGEVRQGRGEERVMLQTEAGQGVLHPPSFRPYEAAPFQKLCEEKELCSGQNWTQPVPG